MRVGYYVHHEGAGHLTRARLVAGELIRRGHEVVLLGSDLGGHPGITLPRDDGGCGHPTDATASGVLHRAPVGDPGTRDRMAAIAQWVASCAPDVVVVDVSAEVTGLLRLLGVRTVVVAQPGDREDEPHSTGFRCATAILAPWPHVARPCAALADHAHKVAWTGGLSRFAPAPSDRRAAVGVVLTGGDGWAQPGLVERVRAEVPALAWMEAGGGVRVDDIAGTLARASVVVTHAGQGAVADVAALGVPAVVVPQPRPHGEQQRLATELGRLGLAVAVPPEVGVDAPWDRLVRDAVRAPSRWWMWRTGRAVGRAADLVERVGRG